ncbi:biopolymer transport protein ExbD [Pedobacter cryoconitis]|jgi:biopolymer transport protein ExbD|uniref:Biopolymer transport protein ExbD n=1 Tax=Pedobacter cryoconitis TaxID=188932 RepID=A0A7W8YVA7_9SPHI|nr:biopolymer transporter ExbD [Pedobacter cryoconitis]MBB5622443.1 biopolymer transport protein ExbD [Pedobacter cryoconitis]MBB5647596.1 biopolymer transport protein ExbD [Pedobacter cryoconitis]
MPRAKVQRKSTSIDMTAMCDVSFLLLTYFILSATAKQPDPLDVRLPTSTYKIKVPEKDIAILTIGADKVFFEAAGQDIKVATLEKIGEQYKISFTPEEKKRFSVIGSFGVPIQSLKQFVMLDGDKRKKSGLETGIPTDSTNNQLADWILQSRKAVAELHSEGMRVSIKGDAEEGYPMVKKIVDILQKQKINKFSLITTAEGGSK